MSTLLTFRTGTGINSYVVHVSSDDRFPQTISTSTATSWYVTTGTSCWIDTISYAAGYGNARASCAYVGNDWDVISDPYVGTSADRSITVYAEKRAAQYACYFYPNGGTPTDRQTVFVDYGGYVNLTNPSNNVSRSGYELTGWMDNDNGTVYATTAKIQIWGTKSFYAQWTKTVSTIYLNGNGGTYSNGNSMVTLKKNIGDVVSFTSYSADLTRAGYTLLGWSANKSATSASYATNGYVTVGGSDATYYAVWQRKAIDLFYWSSASSDPTLIAKGAPVANITAARWNRLKAKIKELREAEGGTWSYSSVASGQSITAAEFNTVRTGISNCGGYATLPSVQSSGNTMLASLFEGSGSLKSALNGAITYYNNN